MASERWVIPGIVKDGVAVPRQNMSLPEGIPVEIHNQTGGSDAGA